MIKVCPSTNPCPEDKLLDYAKSIYDMGVEYLHCDVMDGKFVENKCLDIDVLKNVRDNCNILLDVHLMVDNVYKVVEDYARLKPNIITIHYESPKSTKELIKTLKFIRSKDILAGISIKPNTPIDIIVRLIDYVDLILIMSVEPGKSGQEFIESSIEKIQQAKKLIEDKNVIVEVDGGVNESNYKKIVEAGAEFLVIGSAFYNSNDKKKLLNKIDKHYKD